ncbi:MAG TPA: multidrug effflux MFS transporter [Kiloniellales bacterium]|nr:multidrug effflux MFS transporter [Kiloniellales bacterium]
MTSSARSWLLPLIILLVAFGPVSTDLYLPSLPRLVEVFGTTSAAAQLTLSVFLVGFACGMLIYGPLSDRFGRRVVLIGGISLFVLASVACLAAPSIEWLIAGRFLQALGAAAGPVLGRAVVRDVYGPNRAAQALSYVAMAMALAPAVGPVLGGLVTQAFDWWANFLLLLLFGVIALVGVAVFLPETNRYRDASATEARRLLANYRQLLSSREYLGFVLIVSGGYGGIFSFISGSSFALIGGLGLSPLAYGFSFAGAIMGYMIGSFASARLYGRVKLETLIGLGCLAMLLGSALGVLLALSGILTIAAVVLPASILFLGCGLVMPNGQAGALRPYPRLAGSASAMLGFLQMGSAALLGILVGHLQDGTARAMMLSMFLSALLATVARYRLLPGAALDRSS